MTDIDPTDPAKRNEELKAQQQKSEQQEAQERIQKKGEAIESNKLQTVRPGLPETRGERNSEAAQYGRQTFGGTPRDMSFGVEGDSKGALVGKEFRQGETPMLLANDGKTMYQGTLGADGKSVESWQQVQADGKTLGPPLKVTAERSGLPPEGTSPDRYVNSNRGDRSAGIPGPPPESAHGQFAPPKQGLLTARGGDGSVPPIQERVRNNPTVANETAPGVVPDTSRPVTQQRPSETFNPAPNVDRTNPVVKPMDSQTYRDMTPEQRRDLHDRNQNQARPELREQLVRLKEQGQENPTTRMTRTPGGELVPPKPQVERVGGEPNPAQRPPSEKPVNPNQPSPFEAQRPRPELNIGPTLQAERGRPPIDIFPPGKEGLGGRPHFDREKIGINPELVKIFPGLRPDLLKPELVAKLLPGQEGPQNLRPTAVSPELLKIIDKLGAGGGGLLLDRLNPSRGPQSEGPQRLVELLQGKQFDKISSADQTRLILSELFKGSRDSGGDLSMLIGRAMAKPGEISLGRDGALPPGAKFDLKDATGTVLQSMLSRLDKTDTLAKLSEMISAKPGETSMRMPDALASKLEALAKPDSRELKLEVKAELKSQTNLDASKLTEAVKSAMVAGEVARAIGREPLRDAQQQNVREVNQTPLPQMQQMDSMQARQIEQTQANINTQQEAALTQRKAEEEIAKKREQDEKVEETKRGPSAEELAAMQAERLRTEENRKRLEKEEQERKERQEKRRKEEEERTHVVRKGETLSMISRKYLGNEGNAQLIYARNKSTIKVVNYKGQPYVSLKEGLKLIIPSPKFIANFNNSSTSYKHINFGKIPFASPEEELAFLLGGGLGLGAGASLIGLRQHRLFGKDDNAPPPTRRSFTGKELSDDDQRRANVESVLLDKGAVSAGAVVSPSAEMEGIKHTIRLGETLSSIALRRFSHASYWKIIAWKNKLSLDASAAHSKLPRGTVIFMPTNDEISAYDGNPDEMMKLTPSKCGIFIESDSGISMPALKICSDCGRTTFYTSAFCLKCGEELTDKPIVIDALGIGVDIDLDDLDRNSDAESVEEVVESEAGLSAGAEERAAINEAKQHFKQTPPQAAENEAVDALMGVPESAEPAELPAEAAASIAAVVVSATTPDSNQFTDPTTEHVGEIPLPDVNFAIPKVHDYSSINNALLGKSQEQQQATNKSGTKIQSESGAQNTGPQSTQGSQPTQGAEGPSSDQGPQAAQSSRSNSGAQQVPMRTAGGPDGRSIKRDNDPLANQAALPVVPQKDDSPAEAEAEEFDESLMELFPNGEEILDDSNAKYEHLDEMVRIAESGELDTGDGLCITLEMVSDGEWAKVYQYRVFSFTCYIETYSRGNGSTRPERVVEKSLQPKIALDMARNHFRRSWQQLCTDFWHS